ncbi:hypothetical protein PIB30_094511 [Stylosanthes scabra]|uniref:Uncharacterized protein n=1 Tax=Stylosanthes scabra TaxID=79078 RepID=A0ABU6QXY2_9FABA|nr:hypothetical protein [Stylosanthes scabra]
MEAPLKTRFGALESQQRDDYDASQPVQHDDLVASFRHALRTLNGFDRVLVRELQHPLKDYITDMIDQVLEAVVNDPNFLADRISSQVLDELNRLMINSTLFDNDLKNLVVHEYSRSRKQFLEIFQVELQLNEHEKKNLKEN